MLREGTRSHQSPFSERVKRMKNRELIDILSKFDLDLDVFLEANDDYGPLPITSAEVDAIWTENYVLNNHDEPYWPQGIRLKRD